MIGFAQLMETPTRPLTRPVGMRRAEVRLEDSGRKVEAFVPWAGRGSSPIYQINDRVLVAFAYGDAGGGIYVLGCLGDSPLGTELDEAKDVLIRARQGVSAPGNINLLTMIGGKVNVGVGTEVGALPVALFDVMSAEIKNLKAQIDALALHLTTTAIVTPGNIAPGAANAVAAAAIPITGGQKALNLNAQPGGP